MKTKVYFLIKLILLIGLLNSNTAIGQEKIMKIKKTEQEWKNILNDEEYLILREKGTERPYTGIYNTHYEKGTYNCKGCKTPLFTSDHKYDSKCGWPAFDKAIEGAVEYTKDTSHGMIRIEITCKRCDGHLGHVFEDGPKETTGVRYCVNAASLDFDKEQKPATYKK